MGDNIEKIIPLSVPLSVTEHAALTHIAAKSPFCKTPERLAEYVLQSVLAGARRPGSWERGMLDTLGIESGNELYHSSVELLLEYYRDGEGV